MTNTPKRLRRVLLVDDSELALSAVRHHLTLAGLVVIDVKGADEALWMTRGDFDVAVLDIDLGDRSMNGVERAIVMIGQDRVRHVIFLSATKDAALLEAARRIGPVVDKSGADPAAALLAVIAGLIDDDVG